MGTWALIDEREPCIGYHTLLFRDLQVVSRCLTQPVLALAVRGRDLESQGCCRGTGLGPLQRGFLRDDTLKPGG